MTAAFAALPAALSAASQASSIFSRFSGGVPHGPNSPAVLQAAGQFVQTVRQQLLTTGRSPAGEYELNLDCGSASSPFSCNRLQQATIAAYNALGVPLPTAIAAPPVLTPGASFPGTSMVNLGLPLTNSSAPQYIDPNNQPPNVLLLLLLLLLQRLRGVT